jgi:hypothetical protein
MPVQLFIILGENRNTEKIPLTCVLEHMFPRPEVIWQANQDTANSPLSASLPPTKI